MTHQTTMDTETPGAADPAREAERQEYLARLREHLQDPEFRAIEGFPIGEDEDILALSDPPHYTACPNPFLPEVIARWQREREETRRALGLPVGEEEAYHREPFAADVSEGKTDALYRAHSYHTKVPHLAIVPSILHYTDPGDIVLDGFCGSGMTGVAAQWCASAPEEYRRKVEAEFAAQGLPGPVWGARRAVLNDLAPAATFIAANYNSPFDVDAFAAAGRRLLREVDQELGWMYETLHTDGQTKGRIEYTVWSEVFTCPDCAGEVVFLEEAFDEDTKRVRDSFPCPHCGASLTKGTLQRVFETRPDPALGTQWQRIRFRPCLICYSLGRKRYQKLPDAHDLEVLGRIEAMPLPAEVPTNRFPIEEMSHGSRIAPKGFTHIHHFYLPRAAHAMAALWRKANAHPDARIRHMLLFLVEQAVWGLTVLNRYTPLHYSHVNQYLTGVYYVASQHAECSPRYVLHGKLRRLVGAFREHCPAAGAAALTTGTAAQLDLAEHSIDYVYTDPPFGENIYYADLNFLVESWHRVVTNAVPEAIVDRFKGKGLPEYQRLMQRCFAEYCRVLKPGRWMTVVFHNSRNSVWNAIQEAIQTAGFVVADVRTLDKQQGSYRQLTSSAVKQDLVISAYKPNGGLEEEFRRTAGSTEGAWAFVRAHLGRLPIPSAVDGTIEASAERRDFLLYDRMVAFHLTRGATVPLSAAEFYAGLRERFTERDGMFFLPEQAAVYDQAKMAGAEVQQLIFLVSDEKSAIQWLRQRLSPALGGAPATYQDIQPAFLQHLHQSRYEALPELRQVLEEGFLEDDRGRWYVPDGGRSGDLERLRLRGLWREFDEYAAESGRLRAFRSEAVRAGFARAWAARDYGTIVRVAERLPRAALEEDPDLLMYYDNATLMTE